MSHPDDTGNSAVGKALSALRRLRRPADEPTIEPSPDEVQADVPDAPRAAAEDAVATDPTPPEDDADGDVGADVDDEPESVEDPTAKSVDTVDDAPETVTGESDEPTVSEPDEVTEPDEESQSDDVTEPEVEPEPEPEAVATVEDAADEPVAADVVGPESESESESEASVDDTETAVIPAVADIEPTAPSPAKQPVPVDAAPMPDDDSWRSDTAAPQYIPASTATTSTSHEGRSRRVVLWIASIVVIVVAVAAVVVAVFATRGEPAKPAADEAATAATKYTTALSNGDLTALRTITCGERKQFYDGVSPEAFRQQFETQKANNELVGVRGVKAARVVDPSNAIVEVTAFNTSTPEKTTDVALRLRKDDGEWKVCTAG